MNLIAEDTSPSREEVYQALVRSLRRRKGFGIVFVQCSPAEATRLIEEIQVDLPQKQFANLKFDAPIDNLYDLVTELPNRENLNILFIEGLEKSLEPYIKPGYGGDGDYYTIDTVPTILSHLNQRRELFRDHFHNICFIFFLPLFATTYIIRRSPDFYDWSAGVFDFSEDIDLPAIFKNFGYHNHYWQFEQKDVEEITVKQENNNLNERDDNGELDSETRKQIKHLLEQIPKDALDLLCRSSVFRRPVPKIFWLAMISDPLREGEAKHSPQEQQQAYQILEDHDLIAKEDTNIFQPRKIRNLAYEILQQDQIAWEAAKRQAAHLWLTAYTPDPNAPNLEKIRGYLEAFDHYCEIEDWRIAKDIFLTPLDSFGKVPIPRQLEIWGLYQEGIRVCENILRKSTLDTDVICLKWLGNYHLILGNYLKAVDYYKQSLRISQEINDRWSEGSALGNLGNVYRDMGQYEQAINFLNQSLIIGQEINDHFMEGVSFGSLGDIYYRLGQYEQAIDFLQKFLTIMRKIGSRYGEGNSLYMLGAVYSKLGQYESATDFYKQSLAISLITNNPQTKGSALLKMGETQLRLEQYSESLTHNQAALDIFQEIGFRAGEVEALKNLAEVHQALGEVEVARHYCQQALALATELGIPLAAECEVLLLKLGVKPKEE